MNDFFAILTATLVGCSGGLIGPTAADGGSPDADVIPCACVETSGGFAIWETPTVCTCVLPPMQCAGQASCTCVSAYAATTIQNYCANWNNPSDYCDDTAAGPVFHCMP